MALGKPFWWEDAEPQTRKGQLPASVDVVVIGAGFTGLSAALTLAQAGRNVLVCESDRIGFGASSRNGGQVGAKMRRGFTSIAEEHGADKARAVWNDAREARAYIESLVEREQIDCDFENCSRYYGAHKEKDYETIAKTAEVLNREIGYALEVVPKAAQSKYIDTDTYFGGLVDHNIAAFHPSKYVVGLLNSAERAGARVLSHTPVTAIDRLPSGFTVHTPAGKVAAKHVIAATNGYSGKAIPEIQRRIIPIGSYIIATDPMPRERARALMPGCDLVIDSRRCASYMRLSPDKTRVLYGGRVAATDVSPEVSGPRLKAVLDNIFPTVRNIGFTHAWMGFTGFTFDELPHIGQHDNGLYYAMGYCGSGTAMATYLGHKVALKIMGSPEGRTGLDGIPLQQRSFYRGNPWFLSSVIASYRILDRFRL